jgi:hypothetical protein
MTCDTSAGCSGARGRLEDAASKLPHHLRTRCQGAERPEPHHSKASSRRHSSDTSPETTAPDVAVPVEMQNGGGGGSRTCAFRKTLVLCVKNARRSHYWEHTAARSVPWGRSSSQISDAGSDTCIVHTCTQPIICRYEPQERSRHARQYATSIEGDCRCCRDMQSGRAERITAHINHAASTITSRSKPRPPPPPPPLLRAYQRQACAGICLPSELTASRSLLPAALQRRPEAASGPG